MRNQDDALGGVENSEARVTCCFFSVHQVMVIQKHAHRLTKNAEKQPEDHVSHLPLGRRISYMIFRALMRRDNFVIDESEICWVVVYGHSSLPADYC